VASIWQVVWEWSGFAGATGYTNLYYRATAGDGNEALQACNKSRLLWAGGTAGLVPPSVTVSLQSDVRLLDEATGDLRNIFTVVGVSPVTGAAPLNSYSAASGACVEWLTGVIHGKHLMVGKTFIVPGSINMYQSGGQIASAAISALATNAEAMRTATGPAFGVWGRPRKAVTRPDGTVRPALTGIFVPAISSRVLGKVAVLRSRRD
jgi:hypothetical protein